MKSHIEPSRTAGDASDSALPGLVTPDKPTGSLRISEAAARAGTSTRTLRYYEELGLLQPPGRSTGGARRYTLDDVDRLVRIRELQQLLGFDLGEIRDLVRSEDQLSELRSEFQAGVSAQRHQQILDEALRINTRLREIVGAKHERLATMMDELESKAKLYRSRMRVLRQRS